MAYGMALRIEGSHCQHTSALDSEEAVNQILVSAIEVAGMSLMAGPLVAREGPRNIGKGPGITGIAVLYESHVVIHTYPEAFPDKTGWFIFDLLSCKNFDDNKVATLLKAWAGCDEDNLTIRMGAVGLSFPEPDA